MNINVYVLSPKPVKFYSKACREYEKRLKRYCKLDLKFFKKPEKLLNAIDPDEPIVVIDNTGKQMSSEKLADSIQTAEVGGTSRATVVIADGIPEMKGDNIRRLAVSRMTMSSDLEATVVLEQIYRAYKIINGETYHK